MENANGFSWTQRPEVNVIKDSKSMHEHSTTSTGVLKGFNLSKTPKRRHLSSVVVLSSSPSFFLSPFFLAIFHGNLPFPFIYCRQSLSFIASIFFHLLQLCKGGSA